MWVRNAAQGVLSSVDVPTWADSSSGWCRAAERTSVCGGSGTGRCGPARSTWASFTPWTSPTWRSRRAAPLTSRSTIERCEWLRCCWCESGSVFPLKAFCCFSSSLRFASTRSGHILEIDYSRVTVKNARRLMPAQQQHAERREKWTFNTGGLNPTGLSGFNQIYESNLAFLRNYKLCFNTYLIHHRCKYPINLFIVYIYFDMFIITFLFYYYWVLAMKFYSICKF